MPPCPPCPNASSRIMSLKVKLIFSPFVTSACMCLEGALWVLVTGAILLCSLVRREGPERSSTQKCPDHFSTHTIIHCGGCGGQTFYLQCNADRFGSSCLKWWLVQRQWWGCIWTERETAHWRVMSAPRTGEKHGAMHAYHLPCQF